MRIQWSAPTRCAAHGHPRFPDGTTSSGTPGLPATVGHKNTEKQ